MTIGRRRASYHGNPFLGIYASTNNTHTLFPYEAPEKFVDAVGSALGTKAVRCSISGSNLNGLYSAMNSRGIVLPGLDGKAGERIGAETGLEVLVSRERWNAHRNNIAANDKGGIISEMVGQKERKGMEDCLGVELVPMRIANYSTVGSLCVVNNRGFLAHYAASEDEMKELEGIFKVGGGKGSANGGTGFVAVCMLANDKGYVVGESTTAFEMGRVEEALGFLG
ncbi:MAG TPA: translation initiation factor IF-6 [Candidatus Bilamarchaeaceae archaeon]|nr:translation initiation factor IF-6 [Candidatus Bilamarchaeaceae archaeon]